MDTKDQNLALEFVRVTELAAIAAAKWIGRGDGKAADQAAVTAMRDQFNTIDFSGTIVIGEGAKDESAELYIGERLGTGSHAAYDIAVDPLECTDSVANGKTNSITVIATGPQGSLYHAADAYMNKIAAGPLAASVIDLTASPADNIRNAAKALGKEVSEITVAVLERERHAELIAAIRAAGARVQLFSDGDVSMAIATAFPESPIDLLMGIGASAEGVLAAAALRCLGGAMQCQWKPKDESHVKRLNDAGVTDFSKILATEDLAHGDGISFTATGVLTGLLADGVVFEANRIITHSVVMSLDPKTFRLIRTVHPD